MKIKKFTAESFGCLCGEYEFATDKATLIIERNDTGKSTLVAGIIACLYGFPKEKGSRYKMKEKDVYRPEGGGKYTAKLVVETEGRSITIWRDFDDGLVQITDNFSGRNITEDFRGEEGTYPVGEELLSLTKEGFLKTALVGQLDIQSVREPGGLSSNIQRLADSQSGDRTADEAKSVLENSLEKYFTSGLAGFRSSEITMGHEIDGLCKNIKKIQKEKKELEGKRAEVEEQIEELKKLVKKEESNNKQLEQLDYLSKVAEKNELEEAIKNHNEAQERLNQYQREVEILEAIPIFALEKYPIMFAFRDEIPDEAHLENVLLKISSLQKKLKPTNPLDFKNLLTLFSNLEDAVSDFEGKIKALKDERGNIQKEGYDLSEYPTLQEKFEPLTEQEKDFVSSYTQDLLQLNNERQQKEAERQNIKRKLDTINKRRKRLGIAGAFLVLLSLVLMGAAILKILDAIPHISVIAGFIAGIVLLLLGAVLLLLGGLLKRKRRPRLSRDLGDFVKKQQKLSKEIDKKKAKAENLSQRHHFDSSKKMTTQFKLLNRLDGRTRKLKRVTGEAIQAENAIAKIQIKGYERYRILKTELIPEEEGKLLSEDNLKSTQSRLKVLDRQINQAVAHNASLRKLPVSKTSSEYNKDYRSKVECNNQVRNEKFELLEKVSGIMDDYRTIYPELVDKLAKMHKALKRAQDFKESVSLAREVLDKISKETYQNWAIILNDKVNRILKHFNPDYKDLKFDSNLSFTLTKDDGRRRDQVEVQYRTGAGAKDQIYLAVRMALCDYLSIAEESLPIILDDAFMASDDERLFDGMHFILSEMSKEHQVLILTCHRIRHEEFKKQNPDWFNKHLQICSLQ